MSETSGKLSASESPPADGKNNAGATEAFADVDASVLISTFGTVSVDYIKL